MEKRDNCSTAERCASFVRLRNGNEPARKLRTASVTAGAHFYLIITFFFCFLNAMLHIAVPQHFRQRALRTRLWICDALGMPTSEPPAESMVRATVAREQIHVRTTATPDVTCPVNAIAKPRFSEFLKYSQRNPSAGN